MESQRSRTLHTLAKKFSFVCWFQTLMVSVYTSGDSQHTHTHARTETLFIFVDLGVKTKLLN